MIFCDLRRPGFQNFSTNRRYRNGGNPFPRSTLFSIAELFFVFEQIGKKCNMRRLRSLHFFQKNKDTQK